MLNNEYQSTFLRYNCFKPVYGFFGLDENAVVLDYGCGTGWTSIPLAEKAKKVYAIDIAASDIDLLKKAIADNSVTNLFPSVSDAENLPFGAESFDFVFGNSILHHLHLDKALSEVHRVLKKGGKAAFCEPYGHNPLLNLYRHIKDRYIDKITYIHRPIKSTDRKIFEKYFSSVQFIETGFTSDKFFFIMPIESKILKTMPFTRKFASYVTILLQKPH